MNVMTGQTSGKIQAKPPKKVRRYVVVFQCVDCKKNGFLDDFEGEQKVTCSCGREFCVSTSEGLLPDWAH